MRKYNRILKIPDKNTGRLQGIVRKYKRILKIPDKNTVRLHGNDKIAGETRVKYKLVYFLLSIPIGKFSIL